MAPEREPPEGLLALGVRYEALPVARTGTDPLADLRAIRALRRRLSEIRPDVVLGYNVKPMIYALLAARAAGVPRSYALVTGLGYLFLPDGSRKQHLVSLVARPLYRLALQSASAVFVQNSDDEQDLRRAHLLPRSQGAVQLPGSGIDLAAFPEIPLPEGPPRFLFVGRLLRDKGVCEFVAAARKVKERLPDATFCVVGGPDTNPSAVGASEIERWRAEGIVELTGEIADVRPELSRCTAFVLPSYREGTPRSSLEAMATGRAVITTDAPGCRETVTDGDNGYLVPVRSVDELAAAMIRLADPGSARRMGVASRRKAERQFDVRKVVQTMLETMRLDTGQPDTARPDTGRGATP